MDRDRAHCAASIAVVVCVLLACKPKGGDATANVGPNDEQRAQALCQKLVTAGVARKCDPPQKDELLPNQINVAFDIVGGFPEDRGSAEYDSNAEDFKLPDGATDDGPCKPSPTGAFWCPPNDDYPSLHVSSSKSRLSVSWSSANTQDADIVVGDVTAWEKCRELRDAHGVWTTKKTVAQCAKQYPKEYAAYHALYDAAKRAIDP